VGRGVLPAQNRADTLAMAAAGGAEAAPTPAPGSLAAWAVEVLREPSAVGKAAKTRAALAVWRRGGLPGSLPGDPQPPPRPARDGAVRVVAARDLPRRGKGGTLASRQAILHGLAHIESWAVDLAWDAIARFGEAEGMPRAFFEDFAVLAEDECRHFELLEKRLKAIGSHYGAFPAHDGLWDSAEATVSDICARMAIEHCVHEARGLDALPQTIARFRSNGDPETADVLESTVYPEEVTHCAAGLRWFRHVCERRRAERLAAGNLSGDDNPADGADVVGEDEGEGEEERDFVVEEFHACVRKHFRGPLKPPFNTAARAKAGFTPEWYLPLVDNGRRLADKKVEPQKD